ncbi:Rna pseudouridylate synthase-like protein [Globisporangium polare]
MSTAVTSDASTAAAAPPLPVVVKTEKARRHQHHLADVTPPTSSLDQQQASSEQSEQENGFIEWRGGPQTLEELALSVVSKDAHYLVLNKGADVRLDGDFQVTIEKALARDYPEVEKFRWIHQLDFATSGLMCVGVDRDATALACRLFREKRVQKEYLAVVRGHLPFHPAEYIQSLVANDLQQQHHNIKQCTLSKLGWLIQDTEEFERLKGQQKGSQVHQKDPKYPRGVHHGPSLFHMEKSRIIKERATKNEPLTEEEQAYVALKWRDLPKDQQEPFKQRGQVDKERFVRELTQFLDGEREKVAKKRKYEAMERSDGDGVQDDTKPVNEPVAYVFDDRIAEPSGELFRMQIGDDENPGKASSTIAFVLGHGTRTINGNEQEPVTKVLLRPLTGRRHQLRLHLAHNGFPILGDVTYGDESDDSQRMMLHAWKLWLMAPPEAQKQYGDLFFTSPDPFEDVVPSEREVTTMTFHRQKKQQKQADSGKQRSLS